MILLQYNIVIFHHWHMLNHPTKLGAVVKRRSSVLFVKAKILQETERMTMSLSVRDSSSGLLH